MYMKNTVGFFLVLYCKCVAKIANFKDTSQQST